MAEDRKRWWHVAFISGFNLGNAIGVAIGFFTPNTRERTDANPGGWRRSQLLTWGGLDDVMREYAEEQRKDREAGKRRERLLFNILQHLKGADGDAVEIDPPPPDADLEP